MSGVLRVEARGHRADQGARRRVGAARRHRQRHRARVLSHRPQQARARRRQGGTEDRRAHSAAPRGPARGARAAHRLSRLGRCGVHDRLGRRPRRRTARAVIAVANVLCVVELLQGRALPVSLEVLGQARRVSTELGATLYAVVALPRAPSWSDDDLVATLAAHGADKVVHRHRRDARRRRGAALGHARRGAGGGVRPVVAVAAAVRRHADGARGGGAGGGAHRRGLRARGVRRGATTASWSLFEGAGADARTLGGELEFAVVATVPAGRYQPAVGDDEAEVEVVATSRARRPTSTSSTRRPRRGRARSSSPRGGARRRARRWPRRSAASSAEGRRAGGARLIVSLGPPCPAGGGVERRVRLGAGGDDADYVVAGEPAALAAALARALAEPAKETK